MASKRFGPPIQAEDQRAGVLLSFGKLVDPHNIEKAFPAQSARPSWPRKCACSPRPLGPGERVVARAYRHDEFLALRRL